MRRFRNIRLDMDSLSRFVGSKTTFEEEEPTHSVT